MMIVENRLVASNTYFTGSRVERFHLKAHVKNPRVSKSETPGYLRCTISMEKAIEILEKEYERAATAQAETDCLCSKNPPENSKELLD